MTRTSVQSKDETKTLSDRKGSGSADSESANEEAEPNQVISAKNVRILKVIVIISTILFFVGFVGLAGALIYKIANLETQTSTPGISHTVVPASPNRITADISRKLALPANAIIQKLDISDSYLAIYYEAADLKEIIVLNIANGELTKRIELTPSGK